MSASRPGGRGPMGGGPPGMMGGPAEKPKDFRQTMVRLIVYLRPFWTTLSLILLLAIGSTGFAIVGPRILGDVTNKVVSGYSQERVYDEVMAALPAGTVIPPGTTGADLFANLPPEIMEQIPAAVRPEIEAMDLSQRPGIDFPGILRLVEILVALYVLSAILSYAQFWMMAKVAQRVTYDLRQDSP